jgi:ribosomal-protein-alanine N-acetyltransferase
MGNVIKTERLQLREFTQEDAPGFYELNLDPEVLRYTGDKPFASLAEAEDFIRNYENYERDGFGRWSVFLKETGEYIGFCGLNYRPAMDEIDLGFRFRRAYWGKGYATEAARASLLHGFQVYNLGRIVARAMRANTASHRVIQKLGMRFEKEFSEHGEVWYQYEITREEFLAKQE